MTKGYTAKRWRPEEMRYMQSIIDQSGDARLTDKAAKQIRNKLHDITGSWRTVAAIKSRYGKMAGYYGGGTVRTVEKSTPEITQRKQIPVDDIIANIGGMLEEVLTQMRMFFDEYNRMRDRLNKIMASVKEAE